MPQKPLHSVRINSKMLSVESLKNHLIFIETLFIITHSFGIHRPVTRTSWRVQLQYALANEHIKHSWINIAEQHFSSLHYSCSIDSVTWWKSLASLWLSGFWNSGSSYQCIYLRWSNNLYLSLRLPCLPGTLPLKWVSIVRAEAVYTMQNKSVDPGVPLCGRSAAVHHQDTDTMCFWVRGSAVPTRKKCFNIYEYSNLA